MYLTVKGYFSRSCSSYLCNLRIRGFLAFGIHSIIGLSMAVIILLILLRYRANAFWVLIGAGAVRERLLTRARFPARPSSHANHPSSSATGKNLHETFFPPNSINDLEV